MPEITEELLEVWMDDNVAYFEDCLKIQTKKSELAPFVLNEVQLVLEDIYKDIARRGIPRRVVILKARRFGVSTHTGADTYKSCSMNKNRYGMLIAHDPDSSDFIYEMIRRFHRYNPFKVSTKYNSKKLLHFDRENGGGLDSAIRVAAAGKDDIGSGQTIHHLFLSEVSKWPKGVAEQILTSVLQCVPNDPFTTIVFESTAKGMGGEFYDRFWGAKYRYSVVMKDGIPSWNMEINEDAKDENIYCSIFVPWFVFREYQMDVENDFKKDEEEEELAKAYGLSDRQIRWRRYAISNLCNGDIDQFSQEYPSNAREAFLATGRPVFPGKVVEARIKLAKPPKKRYEIQLTTGNFLAEDRGRFQVWKEPEPGKSYIVSADVCEGLEKGDFDSIDVIEQISGNQVAHWHGKVDPDQLGTMMVFIGKRYNMAWLVPERNNHGLMTVNRILDMGYSRIYVETVVDPPAAPRKRYGWVTGHGKSKGKFAVIDNLKLEVRENTDGIVCKQTLEEMLTFVHMDDGTLGAEGKNFDDRVSSISIAKYVRSRLPMQTLHNGNQSGSVSNRTDPPTAGWT